VEKHFATGLQFFDDPGFRREFGLVAVLAFAFASHNAWVIGRTDLARQRMTQMIAAAIHRPYEVGGTWLHAGLLWARIRDWERAEQLVAPIIAAADQARVAEGSAFSRVYSAMRELS